jgi:hypothetical protein
MKDFNTANSQDELIPAGTIARATFKLKGGGNHGEHNLLSKSDNTGSIGLNAYFTIDDGKYKGRRIYQLIGIEGVKRNAEGEDVWGDMGCSLIRSIIESSHNIHPTDKSEKARKIRAIASYNDLEGLKCLIKIGVEVNKTGAFSDKNKIFAAITPADKNYTSLMNAAIGATSNPQYNNNNNTSGSVDASTNTEPDDDIPF